MASHDDFGQPGAARRQPDRPSPGNDQTGQGPDAADTASFQQFVDDHGDARVDNGRTFRLLSLLAGVIVLVVVIYLLLF